jgi:hypothetical protein
MIGILGIQYHKLTDGNMASSYNSYFVILWRDALQSGRLRT